jgi:hypothetical protein
MWSIPESNSQGRVYMTVIIVFAVIAALTFGMRIYSRRLHKLAFDASDYTCLLSMVGVSVCGCKKLGRQC